MKIVNAEHRKDYILQYVAQHAYADVVDLSRLLGVSEMTIRRDFEKLEKDQLLLRVRGGARSMPQMTYEAPLTNRIKENAREKDLIGAYAAGLVEDGDVIALDASSTVYAMSRHITKPVTAITNNISATIALCEKEQAEVVLLGGKVNKESRYTVEFEPSRCMDRYHADKAFVSSKAIDIQHGITDALPLEAEEKKALIRGSREVFVLADHTKLDTCAFYKVWEIEGIHHLITDAAAHTQNQLEFLEQCRQRDIQVHLVEDPDAGNG